MRTVSTPMSPEERFLVTRILPWPFIIIGGLILCFGLIGVVRARDSVDWPTVPGEIVSPSVESHFSSGSGRRNHGGSSSHAKIPYEFVVDGVKYHGSRVAFGDYGSNNSSHAYSIVNQDPEGQQVTGALHAGRPIGMQQVGTSVVESNRSMIGVSGSICAGTDPCKNNAVAVIRMTATVRYT